MNVPKHLRFNRLLAREFFASEQTPIFARRGVLRGDHWRHDHDFMEIVLILGGRGKHQTIYGDGDLRGGDVLALRPGVWHYYHDCRRLQFFNCCFGVDLLRRELAWMLHDPVLSALCWPGGSRRSHVRGFVWLHLGHRDINRCAEQLTAIARLGEDDSPARRAQRIARLILFVSELARHVDPSNMSAPSEGIHPTVLEAVKRLEEDIAAPWTLSGLTDELRIAEGYFVRRFKSATGLPPMAYLAKLRAERAAAMLLGTSESIANIGRVVGWDDPNYFARRFRSHFGVSASAYRNKHSRGTTSDVRRLSS